jgi:hypothetical protein
LHSKERTSDRDVSHKDEISTTATHLEAVYRGYRDLNVDYFTSYMHNKPNFVYNDLEHILWRIQGAALDK